jgi:hypothetical protein
MKDFYNSNFHIFVKKVLVIRGLFIITLVLTYSVNVFPQFLSPQVDSIPMRDGKKLAADVYLPNGGAVQRPTILIQTPYNRLLYRWGLPLGIGIQINQCNYNIVILDWRGFFGSAQAAVTQPNRGYDGYDAVEWIATQSWSDGNVGTWGPSALGRVQYLTAKEDPPHLKCIVPVVASPYYKYGEYYPGGVLRTEYVQQLDQLGFGIGLLVYPHPFYDIVWQYSESNSSYPQSIKIPCLMVGGWYDHNINEMVDFFAALQTSSPVTVRNKHKFLIGPWVHGGHSTAYVGSSQQGELDYPLAAGWGDSLAMMFFDFYLRNISNNWDANQPVMYYSMGEHVWAQSASWPPAAMMNVVFKVTGSDALTTGTVNGTVVYDFPYDPADPSPTHGGATLRNDLLQGPYDQTLVVESRTDALVLTSEVFASPVYIQGKPLVHLNIRSSTKDTDFAVRLCDVYPDGRSMLLSDGIKRCRFIGGYTVNDTASLVPGSDYVLEVELSHLAQVFMPGHRLRLIITGSNYPRYDNNLNNGLTMYAAGDTVAATLSVISFSDASASYIIFPGGISTGVSYKETGSNFRVYPVPVNDILYIEGNEPAAWIITDMSGREILNFNTEMNGMLDVSSLTQGIYILKDKSGLYRYHIIKMHE